MMRGFVMSRELNEIVKYNIVKYKGGLMLVINED